VTHLLPPILPRTDTPPGTAERRALMARFTGFSGLTSLSLIHFLLSALLPVGRCFDTAVPDEPTAEGNEHEELASFLQQPTRSAPPTGGADQPLVVPLRRESVPIYRRGKVASYKTSYSGALRAGTPAQEFRVVFDTGSGHVVLPAVECESPACLKHRRYDMAASSTSVAINKDGSVVQEGELSGQATIGFGTGQITGEFVRERVCFGESQGSDLCAEMHVIAAVEMSTHPFKSFKFDGILGLGLPALSLTRSFSAFHVLTSSGLLPSPRFGVFLTEGEDGEESEISLGGADARRHLGPLRWAPVAMPEKGHWLVEIEAVRIGGRTLEACVGGGCRGVVDTGTSHWGVPAPYDAEVASLLTKPAGDLQDCRQAEAPDVDIELKGFNLTLKPFNYMRRLPLRAGVEVGSKYGVFLPNGTDTAALPSTPTDGVQPAGQPAAGAGEGESFCRPRLLPVRLPEPLGPKLFILGEPLLHRYYTVFDWENQQVGFGLANSRRNSGQLPTAMPAVRSGASAVEAEIMLMQQSVRMSKVPAEETVEVAEEAVLVQVRLRLTRRPRRR